MGISLEAERKRSFSDTVDFCGIFSYSRNTKKEMMGAFSYLKVSKKGFSIWYVFSS